MVIKCHQNTRRTSAKGRGSGGKGENEREMKRE